MVTAIDEDLFGAEVTADPYAYYRRLREEEPVYWNTKHEVWVMTNYKDLTWIARHPEFFSSEVRRRDRREPYPPIPEDQKEMYAAIRRSQTNQVIQKDPPRHTEVRRVIHGYFTPKSMEKWRPMIKDAIKFLLDQAEENGQMEMMKDFATPLPLLVISELMGMPAEDRPFLREMAKRLLDVATPSENRAKSTFNARKELSSYLNPFADERLKNPGDDLLSLLCQGEKAGIINREEVLTNSMLLLLAGHETTINLICNGALAFIRHPEQWDLFRENPSEKTVRATEECLRYDSPIKGIERIAAQDVELGGKEIKEYDRLIWMIASANRDPNMFPDPDTFDIDRYPNPHVAFGSGVHHCLGAYLARLEGQEAFLALAERFPRMELLDENVEYHPHINNRTAKGLHITWN